MFKSVPIIYLHIKSQNYYLFVCVSTNELTLEPMVVYQSIEDKKIWVRPEKEFNEKFVKLSSD